MPRTVTTGQFNIILNDFGQPQLQLINQDTRMIHTLNLEGLRDWQTILGFLHQVSEGKLNRSLIEFRNPNPLDK